jgi:hypothetical protein
MEVAGVKEEKNGELLFNTCTVLVLQDEKSLRDAYWWWLEHYESV